MVIIWNNKKLMTIYILFLTSTLLLGFLGCVLANTIPPVIDISPLLTKELDPRDASVISVLTAIDTAAKTYGAFMVVNHGISEDDITQNFQSATNLFSLPEEEKLAMEFKFNTSTFGRGYIGFGKESGVADYFEPKEGYSYGYPGTQPYPPEAYGWLASPNRWPTTLPASDKTQLERLFGQFHHISTTLLQSLLFYREQNDVPTRLNYANGEQISILRLFHYFTPSYITEHYPTFTANPAQQSLGSSPHTDWGMLTLILQNAQALQFFYQGEWHDVPHIPNAVVVNVGDFFSLVTKRDYPSPIHRVLCPEEKNRLSFVYFANPNYYATIPSAITAEVSEKKKSSVGEGDVEQEVSIEGGRQEIVKHNTLVQIEEDAFDSSSSVSRIHTYGRYIKQKWNEVYRSKN